MSLVQRADSRFVRIDYDHRFRLLLNSNTNKCVDVIQATNNDYTIAKVFRDWANIEPFLSFFLSEKDQRWGFVKEKKSGGTKAKEKGVSTVDDRTPWCLSGTSAEGIVCFVKYVALPLLFSFFFTFRSPLLFLFFIFFYLFTLYIRFDKGEGRVYTFVVYVFLNRFSVWWVVKIAMS